MPVQNLEVNKALEVRVWGSIWMWAHSTSVSWWQGELALWLRMEPLLPSPRLRCSLSLLPIGVGRGAC